jgi:hypothetical protein
LIPGSIARIIKHSVFSGLNPCFYRQLGIEHIPQVHEQLPVWPVPGFINQAFKGLPELFRDFGPAAGASGTVKTSLDNLVFPAALAATDENHFSTPRL